MEIEKTFKGQRHPHLGVEQQLLVLILVCIEPSEKDRPQLLEEQEQEQQRTRDFGYQRAS